MVAEREEADNDLSDLRKKLGATFHCCPLLVMMVTDFLF
jgi:hypothetical protein